MKKIVVCFLIIVTLFTLCACSLMPEKAILGSWKNQSTILGVVTETTYTFNEDGTGVKSNILDIGFTYSFKDEKLYITTNALGLEITEEYSYEFSGDTLMLTGSDGNTIDFKKVK